MNIYWHNTLNLMIRFSLSLFCFILFYLPLSYPFTIFVQVSLEIGKWKCKCRELWGWKPLPYLMSEKVIQRSPVMKGKEMLRNETAWQIGSFAYQLDGQHYFHFLHSGFLLFSLFCWLWKRLHRKENNSNRHKEVLK